MKANEVSNSMLIEYLYENIEDLNQFLSDLPDEFEVSKFLGLLERIVQEHVDQSSK